MVGLETVCEGSVRAERGDGICALGLEGVSEKCEMGGDDEDEISQSRHGSGIESAQAHTRARLLDGYIDAKPTAGPVPFAVLPLPLTEATPDGAFGSVVLNADAPWSSGCVISRTRVERDQHSSHSIVEWWWSRAELNSPVRTELWRCSPFVFPCPSHTCAGGFRSKPERPQE